MAPPSQGTKRQIETLDLETTRRRLTEKDLKDALKAANDLREHIENGKTKDLKLHLIQRWLTETTLSGN